jgi:hypothetical protein
MRTIDLSVSQFNQEPFIYKIINGSYKLASEIMTLQVSSLKNIYSRLSPTDFLGHFTMHACPAC